MQSLPHLVRKPMPSKKRRNPNPSRPMTHLERLAAEDRRLGSITLMCWPGWTCNCE